MSFVGRVLDTQEAIGVEHEDRRPVCTRLGGIGPGFGVLADDFDELIDAIFFCAEQQGDVTASEKAADRIDPGRPRKAHTDQSLGNAIGVLALHNSQNQLHRGPGATLLSRRPLCHGDDYTTLAHLALTWRPGVARGPTGSLGDALPLGPGAAVL